jgi:hypothetical protein
MTQRERRGWFLVASLFITLLLIFVLPFLLPVRRFTWSLTWGESATVKAVPAWVMSCVFALTSVGKVSMGMFADRASHKASAGLLTRRGAAGEQVQGGGDREDGAGIGGQIDHGLPKSLWR